MPNPTRRAAAIVALAAAIIAGAVALDLAPATAQSDDETGRIVARRLDDGRTEFGWQPAGAARILPRARYFPADARVDRWLNSSPVEVEGEAIGRINARLHADGRIEFGFTPTDGERIEPRARYFPVDARVGRWLRSTEIAISAAPATGFVAVAAGGEHSCAIRAGSGAIECWGWNYFGQTDAPTGRFTAVSAGYSHTCGLRESGAIECWGYNNEGQTNAPAGGFTAISANGDDHTCAIRVRSGAIECWGRNDVGQLDDIPAGSFSAVSAGYGHSCAIRTNGEIECWGSNTTSRQDPNTGEDVSFHTGQATAPAGSFSAVSAAYSHSCAIRPDGAIECWGGLAVIEGLPSGGASVAQWELPLPPAGSFTAVSAGSDFANSTAHSCAIRAESGAIACWGLSGYGLIDARPTGRFTAVSASGNYHACAIRDTGAIVCWGDNTRGQTDAPAP